MTPAEQAGLKVGDRIRVIENYSGSMEVGSIITLVEDDGSYFPYFLNEKTQEPFCWHAFDAHAKWEKIDSSPSYTEEDLKKLWTTEPSLDYYDSLAKHWQSVSIERLDSTIAALMIARLRIKEGRV